MSSFMVSDECMHVCVSALLEDRASCEQGDDLGRKLFEMNSRAVNARYNEKNEAPEVQLYRYSPRAPERMRQLKALESLRYQCSEGDVPKEALYMRLDSAINELRGEIIHALPAYQALRWG